MVEILQLASCVGGIQELCERAECDLGPHEDTKGHSQRCERNGERLAHLVSNTVFLVHLSWICINPYEHRQLVVMMMETAQRPYKDQGRHDLHQCA